MLQRALKDKTVSKDEIVSGGRSPGAPSIGFIGRIEGAFATAVGRVLSEIDGALLHIELPEDDEPFGDCESPSSAAAI